MGSGGGGGGPWYHQGSAHTKKLPPVFACVIKLKSQRIIFNIKKSNDFRNIFAQLNTPAVPATYVPLKLLYRRTVRSSTTEPSARNPSSSSSSYAFSPSPSSPKGDRGRGRREVVQLAPRLPSSLLIPVSFHLLPPPCNPVRLTSLGRKRKEGLLFSLSFSRGRRGGGRSDAQQSVWLAQPTEEAAAEVAVSK